MISKRDLLNRIERLEKILEVGDIYNQETWEMGSWFSDSLRIIRLLKFLNIEEVISPEIKKMEYIKLEKEKK